MDNYIQQLNADLEKAYQLMQTLAGGKPVYEDILSLYIIYKAHQHTNTLIDYAQHVIDEGNDLDGLLADAEKLKALATDCQKLYVSHQSALDALDNDALFDAKLKPFKDAENSEIAIATPLWRKSQELSNRMDFLPFDCEEYKEKEQEYEKVKADYDFHHAKVGELHDAWYAEFQRCIVAMRFRVEDFHLVLHYMLQISQSIIDTVNAKKGDKS